MEYLVQRLGIKRPVNDYRSFTLQKINDPRYEHLKLLSGWLIYFALYFLTENLIPVSACHVVHSKVDDLIPFNEYFLVFYCGWFALIIITMVYFLLYDTRKFKEFQVFIMITQAIAMVVYIVYPTVQMLRPAVMPNDSFLCGLMSLIYAFDTPTGVCPSLHVAYSMGIAAVWCKYKDASVWWKAFIVITIIMICLSVMFVKQHSFVDVMAALPVGMAAYLLVYGRHSIVR